MKNDEFRAKFTTRLLEALRDTGIREDKWAITLYRWIGKKGNNPWICRKWMNSSTKPGKANLELIAKELGVKSEWLEYGTGEKCALDEVTQTYVDQAVDLLKTMNEEELQRAIRHIQASID